MDNYIVRIYRYEKDKPRKLMGIVETVGEEGKKAFTEYEELWEILNSSKKQGSNREIKKGRSSDDRNGVRNRSNK